MIYNGHASVKRKLHLQNFNCQICLSTLIDISNAIHRQLQLVSYRCCVRDRGVQHYTALQLLTEEEQQQNHQYKIHVK